MGQSAAGPPAARELIGDTDFAHASEERGQLRWMVVPRRAVAAPRPDDERAARLASAPARADRGARSSAPAPPTSPCRPPHPYRRERRWSVPQTVHRRVPTTRRRQSIAPRACSAPARWSWAESAAPPGVALAAASSWSAKPRGPAQSAPSPTKRSVEAPRCPPRSPSPCDSPRYRSGLPFAEPSPIPPRGLSRRSVHGKGRRERVPAHPLLRTPLCERSAHTAGRSRANDDSPRRRNLRWD
jgi:hypothetical protein